MRPVWTDRVAVLGVLAGVLVWLGCLATLWGLTLDTVQSERLAMVVILLIECWVLCSRRWKLLSMAEVVIARCGWMKRVPLSDALRHRLGTTREDGRKRMRLLATASVGAVIGGILSTLWIPLAGVICNWLGSVFLFGETTWWLIERVLLAVGMLPMAAGLVGLLYTTYVVRVTGGRDTYASVLRDWLMSLTIASFALAAIRFFGCDLLVVVWTVAGAMLLVSLVSVSRAEVATHPRKTMLPFGQVDRSARRMVEYGFGGLTLVLLVQQALLLLLLVQQARQRAFAAALQPECK